MKRIFEIKSASGVRVDRHILSAQLNAGAFDGCFSVKDITDDHADWAKENVTRKAYERALRDALKTDESLMKDLALKGTAYSRMTFDGDFHMEYVDAETVTLTRLPVTRNANRFISLEDIEWIIGVTATAMMDDKCDKDLALGRIVSRIQAIRDR